MGACRRAGVEPNVEVIETRAAGKRSFQTADSPSATEGCAWEAAYHKEERLSGERRSLRNAVPSEQPNGCNNGSISVGIEPSRCELGIGFLVMGPTLIIAALIAASPALAGSCPQGQFYRARLNQCVSLSSALARPYLGALSSQKNRAEGETIDTANLGEEIETSPEGGPPAKSDPLTADPPPDEMDEAAWLMIPLLRAAEARWAAMVSPLRDETPPPDPWPWLSVYGLGKRPQQ